MIQTDKMPSHTLVVNRLNLLAFFISVLYRMLGYRVYYYSRSSLFDRSSVRRLCESLRIAPMDFQQSRDVDIGYVYGDIHDVAADTARSCWSPRMAAACGGLFPGISELEKKLFVIFKSYVDYRCQEMAALVTWIKGNPGQGKTRVLSPMCRLRRFYLKRSGVEAKASAACFLLNVYGWLAGLAKGLFGHWPSFARKSDAGADPVTLPGDISGRPRYENEILYFPHQSIMYGDLFIKDQFYNPSRHSPYHSRNILHVELRPMPDQRSYPNMARVYEELEIRFCVLPARGRATMFRALPHFIREFRWSGLEADSLCLALLPFVVSTWSHFQSYRDTLRAFPRARIALLGYEMLFPKPLALALESRGIRTVASQERLVTSTYYGNYGYILDTYLCAGRAVCEQLMGSDEKFVRSCLPVGLPRSDVLYRYIRDPGSSGPSKYRSGEEKLLLAFDFQSYPDEQVNARQTVVNWRSNKAFYEDMVRLARAIPYLEVVIRGKNAEWQSIPYFQETWTLIKQCPNLTVSMEYDRVGYQYELAAAADMVVAKHTSIGDECLANGKPVLFHDFLPNTPAVMSRIFDYEGYPVYVFSYQELEDRVRKYFEQGYYMGEDELLGLQRLINDGAADGGVHKRIRSQLDRIYAESSGSLPARGEHSSCKTC